MRQHCFLRRCETVAVVRGRAWVCMRGCARVYVRTCVHTHTRVAGQRVWLSGGHIGRDFARAGASGGGTALRRR